MAFLQSDPPLDVSPGHIAPIRFRGIPISQYYTADLGNLGEMIRSSTPGAPGLKEVKKILARRSGEKIRNTWLSPKNNLSMEERILGTKKCVDGVLSCRPMLPPVILDCVNAFVQEKPFKKQKNSPEKMQLEAIIADQKKHNKLVLRYGALTVQSKKSDQIRVLCGMLLSALDEVPVQDMPEIVIRLSRNPKVLERFLKRQGTADTVLDDIRFQYVALQRTHEKQDVRNVA